MEVFDGTGNLVEIPYDGGVTALQELTEILKLKQSSEEPYSPVGWSKCGGCGFHDWCWPRAEARKDVALVMGVDQGLARALREEGVETAEDLLSYEGSYFSEELNCIYQLQWENDTLLLYVNGKEFTSLDKVIKNVFASDDIDGVLKFKNDDHSKFILNCERIKGLKFTQQ